jgi:Cu/Ag efflux pump CusA
MRERFAPIVMTAMTTVVALLPLMILGNIAGLEIVRPMAVVIVGGLVTSTLLSLVVVPALYVRFGAGRAPALDVGGSTEFDDIGGSAAASRA